MAQCCRRQCNITPASAAVLHQGNMPHCVLQLASHGHELLSCLLAGMDITFRGVEGEFTLRDSPAPVLLLAGGIGEPADVAL